MGNICDLEMTIGHLMIELLPVHLRCEMVPPGMARVFTKHKQVIISALCPTGMGVAGVDVVLVSIREALRCWWSPQIAPFFLIVRAQCVWVKNILIDFFITDIQLFTWQDIHWWTGVMWLTLMWLAIRTLLLMAPIHCRGSIGEQVV